MTYRLENNFGKDKFGVHTHISKTLSEIILDENLDLSKGSFTIGLFGKWGSGKSMIINHLKEKHLSSESGIVYVYLDVWKYVNTSLYRSILFDLEDELINSDNWDVCEKFKDDGYKYVDDSLKDILDRDVQIEKEEPQEQSLLKRIKGLFRKYWIFISIMTLTLVFKIISDLRDWKGLKDVLGYVFQLFIVIGGLKMFEGVFKDIGKNFISKSSIRVVSSPPTFSQDQFEKIFKDMINKSLNSINPKVKTKRMVVVFDNIDRCEPELSYQTLTGLRTFMESKNCIYIIPCDDKEILNHLNKNTKGIPIDFMDKIFQTYLRIPNLEEFDRDDFIDDLLKDSIVPIEDKDFGTIKSILYRGYKGQTPRQINRFINDYETYYRLVENIDPKKEVLLKNLNLFTFFVVIKQIYPEVESLFVKYPDFFSSEKDNHTLYNKLYDKCIEEGKSIDHSKQTKENFKFYIDTFEKRLNLKEVKDHLNYVFLKTDIRFDYIRLKQDLLNLNENLVITQESPVLVKKIFEGFLNKKENVFLEDSISLLGRVISKNPDDIPLNNMFKTIWSFRNEVPKEIIYGNIDLIHSKLETLKTIGTKTRLQNDYKKIIVCLFKRDDYKNKYQEFFDDVLVEMIPEEFKKCFFFNFEDSDTVEDDIIKDELNVSLTDTNLKPTNYLINSSNKNITDYIPIDYVNDQINEYVFENSFEDEPNKEILQELRLFLNKSDVISSDLSLDLSKKIDKHLTTQHTVQNRTVEDDNILFFLEWLDPQIDYDPTFYKGLFSRTTFLISRRCENPGYSYFLCSLKLLNEDDYGKKILQLFQGSVLFQEEVQFINFLNFLDSQGLIVLLEKDEFSNVFIKRVQGFGLWKELHNLIDSVVLLGKKEILYDKEDPRSVVSLFLRIKTLNNKYLNSLKSELLNILIDYELDDSNLIDEIEEVIEGNENKVDFLIRNTSNLFKNVLDNKDLICDRIENLKNYRSDLNRSHKSKMTKQFKKWKSSISNVKYVSKIRRRL